MKIQQALPSKLHPNRQIKVLLESILESLIRLHTSICHEFYLFMYRLAFYFAMMHKVA
jgi:hypothetical protein